jgi:molybdenum cofactor synthesis domain-containing protein
MCDQSHDQQDRTDPSVRTVPLQHAVGTVLAHDITEIRKDEFKGRAFRKGHVIRPEDVCHLQRLGKEHLYVLQLADDEMHEDEAAHALARALMGSGVRIQGEPKEGKINIIADRDGLLKIDLNALLRINMLGDVMCATLHTNSLVKKDQIVAGTRAIPLVVKRSVIEEVNRIAEYMDGQRTVEVKALRKPRVGVVVTGNEVYNGTIKDAFAAVIAKKIEAFCGEIVGVYYAPDDRQDIVERLRELLRAGADLLITTGGMSVDPDDVTRYAIKSLGAQDIVYGSAVLPGAMFLVGYVSSTERSDLSTELQNSTTADPHQQHRTPDFAMVPVLGIPACGMYHKTTAFDLVLPRILAGEQIGRRELSELGHGGLCLNCNECRYPVCPFGK